MKVCIKAFCPRSPPPPKGNSARNFVGSILTYIQKNHPLGIGQAFRLLKSQSKFNHLAAQLLISSIKLCARQKYIPMKPVEYVRN